MTEPNHEHEPATAQSTTEWPEAAAERITDPSVVAIVATLDRVQALPVTEHETVYGELHDALLRALNEDPPNGEAGA